MTLQTVKSSTGKLEYVLLPYAVYRSLKAPIETEISKLKTLSSDDYVPFDPADYVDNPVALARIKAHVRQKELADKLGVSQAYISKLERQQKVSPAVMSKVAKALQKR
jgi:DNA-binding XRE family transcriptional regulator